MAQTFQQKKDEYLFKYPWETVVKAFWNKYPSHEFKSIIFNKVVDIKLLDDDSLIIKRLVYFK